jgi:hypothetical protein
VQGVQTQTNTGDVSGLPSTGQGGDDGGGGLPGRALAALLMAALGLILVAASRPRVRR